MAKEDCIKILDNIIKEIQEQAYLAHGIGKEVNNTEEIAISRGYFDACTKVRSLLDAVRKGDAEELNTRLERESKTTEELYKARWYERAYREKEAKQGEA